ncbi:septation protein IspZ [Rickettsiaceae bacterium]|nr:septation protein IspZ [Rickettsiaceae bacterium]
MIKFFSEIMPLVAFFIGYKMGGILNATLYMVVASVIAMVITYFYERKINKINLISTILLIMSAGLTLFSGNLIFIKMKPTILYCLFAITFLITNFKWKPAIQYALGSAIKFKDEKCWYVLNTRFMFFFLLMAFLNELVWRNFDENVWVNFKVFGAMPITLVFTMLQIPFIIKNKGMEEAS